MPLTLLWILLFVSFYNLGAWFVLNFILSWSAVTKFLFEIFLIFLKSMLINIKLPVSIVPALLQVLAVYASIFIRFKIFLISSLVFLLLHRFVRNKMKFVWFLKPFLLLDLIWPYTWYVFLFVGFRWGRVVLDRVRVCSFWKVLELSARPNLLEGWFALLSVRW